MPREVGTKGKKLKKIGFGLKSRALFTSRDYRSRGWGVEVENSEVGKLEYERGLYGPWMDRWVVDCSRGRGSEKGVI